MITTRKPFRASVLSAYGNVPILSATNGPQRPSDNIVRFPVRLRPVPAPRAPKEAS